MDIGEGVKDMKKLTRKARHTLRMLSAVGFSLTQN